MKRWNLWMALICSLCLSCSAILPAAASGTPSGEDKGLKPVEEQQTSYGSGDYTIRIFSGNQGTFADGSTMKIISVAPEQPGQEIQIQLNSYQENIRLKDTKYYVRGIRESGRDNSTVEAASFIVGKDMDFVIAYGLKGKMVGYTVEFVDTSGRTLAKSLSLEGKEGEKQIVSYQYIEGYRPQAYNLAKTLKNDPGENIFRFVYTRNTAPEGAVIGEGGEIIIYIDGETTVLPGATVVGGGGAAGTGGGGTAEGPQAGDEDIAAEETPLAGTPEQLIDLDDEQTPLSGNPFSGITGNATLLGIPIPLIAVTGSIIAGGLWYVLFYRKRKKKKGLKS